MSQLSSADLLARVREGKSRALAQVAQKPQDSEQQARVRCIVELALKHLPQTNEEFVNFFNESLLIGYSAREFLKLSPWIVAARSDADDWKWRQALERATEEVAKQLNERFRELEITFGGYAPSHMIYFTNDEFIESARESNTNAASALKLKYGIHDLSSKEVTDAYAAATKSTIATKQE